MALLSYLNPRNDAIHNDTYIIVKGLHTDYTYAAYIGDVSFINSAVVVDKTIKKYSITTPIVDIYEEVSQYWFWKQ